MKARAGYPEHATQHTEREMSPLTPLTIRPARRVFTQVASIPGYGQLPLISRLKKACARSSIASHRRDTWVLETPLPSMACTGLSTECAQMPWMYASGSSA